MIPSRRRHSRSASLQVNLPPVLPQEVAADRLTGFPRQMTDAGEEATSGRDKRKRQKVGPDICRRCGQGGKGTHAKLACLRDGGPRPVSGAGDRKFNTVCPNWPGIGLPFPMPKRIFSPKTAQLEKEGFTSVYEEVQQMILMDRQRDLTKEQTNFVAFVGGSSTITEKKADHVFTFDMSLYVEWAQARVEAEAAARVAQSASRQGKKAAKMQGGQQGRLPQAGSSKPRRKRLNELSKSDESSDEE
jgi:hypothetical protein